MLNRTRTALSALLAAPTLFCCQGAAFDPDSEPVGISSSELATSLIAKGSSWRFSDDGRYPGATWTTAGFVDTSWKQGAAQIGYGDGDEKTVASYGPQASKKYTTTYFRKTFRVEDASRITSAQLQILRDDGAVVYLNGKEVFRTNMPAGVITNTTFASSVIAGRAENAWVSTSIAPSAFVSGTNIIAVEVHQSDLLSSDLSFDLGLSAEVSAPPPTPTTSPTTPPPPPGSGPSASCLPFDPPALSTLRASSKKVFAHYFSPYPISLDNADPASDYYQRHYLQPSGESGKFAYCGGFLKQRPLPQPRRTTGDYEIANFEQEVRRAISLGIDGFTYDILNYTGTHWNRFQKLLTAAKNVDPAFRIVLMPDMTSTYTGDDASARTAFVDSIASVASHPSTYRLPDGRLLLAPFAADRRTPAWWNGTLSALAAKGVRATLWPVFVSPWNAATKNLDAVADVYGTSSWGTRTVTGAPGQVTNAQQAHALGLKWMTSVAPQDTRPKDLVFTEANNTQAMRALWDSARQGDADWVQLVTWNDYSESSEFSPSTGTQWAIFDLTAYYTTWFKTGVQPAIKRDAIYYSHRQSSTTAAPDLSKQREPYRVVNGAPPSNEIELLAFLTAPATLRISVGGTVENKDVPAGIQSFRVPIREGTPTFQILRNGASVASVTSAFPISNQITYQDLLYRSGGSLTCDRSALMK